MTIKKFINLALDNQIIDVRNSENLHNFLNEINGKKTLNQDDLRLKCQKIIDYYRTMYGNPYTILAWHFGYSLNQILGACKGNLKIGAKLAEKVEKKYDELKNEGKILQNCD